MFDYINLCFNVTCMEKDWDRKNISHSIETVFHLQFKWTTEKLKKIQA